MNLSLVSMADANAFFQCEWTLKTDSHNATKATSLEISSIVFLKIFELSENVPESLVILPSQSIAKFPNDRALSHVYTERLQK